MTQFGLVLLKSLASKRTETGYLFMTLAVTEVICRMIWGKIAKFMKTSAMIITWSLVFLIAYAGMALARTFYEFLICFILIGVAFAGVGCHKHSFTGR